MLYAINSKEEKVKATPKQKAVCPLCNGNVISKCGKINIWHWAHESLEECDKWGEGESTWHLGWKELVKPEFCEVRMKNHIADIYNGQLVIELQNSPISYEEIEERENFYGNMIWLFNGKNFEDNFDLRGNSGPYRSFRWKHPRKSLWNVKKRMFIEFEEGIFEVEKIYDDCPCGGWGYLISKEEFIKKYLKKVLKNEI